MTDNIGATFRYRQRVREAFENYKFNRQAAWVRGGRELTSECIREGMERAWATLRFELKRAGSRLESERNA